MINIDCAVYNRYGYFKFYIW